MSREELRTELKPYRLLGEKEYIKCLETIISEMLNNYGLELKFKNYPYKLKS